MRLIRLPFLSLLPWKYQSSEPRDEAQTESSVAAQAKESDDRECRFCQSVTQIITLSINRSSDVLAGSGRDYRQLCSTFRRIARQRGWQNTYYSQDFNHLDKLYILISALIFPFNKAKFIDNTDFPTQSGQELPTPMTSPSPLPSSKPSPP